MHTKLTLRLKKNLIEEAKQWAEDHNISLSQVVSMFFERLTLEKASPPANSLHPMTQRLLAVTKKKKSRKPPTDEQLKKDYHRHIEEKHS